jgi:ubiquinone/menaquinone biosynthesis C-methylase UbiE
MDPSILPLLCDPTTRAPLHMDPPSNAFLSSEEGRRYLIRDGIPVFFDQTEVSGTNSKYQAMYDRLAPGYDFAERIYYWFTRQPSYRVEVQSELEIPQANSAQRLRVLEVSVGTGANLRALAARGDFNGIEYFGLDLSWGMLRQCSLNCRRRHLPVHLFQGQAELLPFRDEVFDCVFHVGGINFFSDQSSAIHEMIRVAKPGSKIVIVDETAKVVSNSYQKNAFTRKYFEKGTENVGSPIQLIPVAMRQIEAHEIAGGKLYCLTFRKP